MMNVLKGRILKFELGEESDDEVMNNYFIMKVAIYRPDGSYTKHYINVKNYITKKLHNDIITKDIADSISKLNVGRKILFMYNSYDNDWYPCDYNMIYLSEADAERCMKNRRNYEPREGV